MDPEPGTTKSRRRPSLGLQALGCAFPTSFMTGNLSVFKCISAGIIDMRKWHCSIKDSCEEWCGSYMFGHVLRSKRDHRTPRDTIYIGSVTLAKCGQFCGC